MFAGLASSVHLIILLLIILLLFGAQRLPELGRSLGQGIQEFKEGVNTKDSPEERRTTEALEEGEKARTKAAQNEEEEEEELHKKKPERGGRWYREFRRRLVVSFEGCLIVGKG